MRAGVRLRPVISPGFNRSLERFKGIADFPNLAGD
jgi:hypothetical protein